MELLDYSNINLNKNNKLDVALVKQIVDYAIKNTHSQEIILDRMRELKRKRKIVNFIDN